MTLINEREKQKMAKQESDRYLDILYRLLEQRVHIET